MEPALYNPLQMSQITRCPACSTQFKVVADQLRISDGWVRCGHCAEVFDASESLMPAPPPALLPGVSLTDVRPPPKPVARVDQSLKAWGAPQALPEKVSLPAVSEPDVSTGTASAMTDGGLLSESPFSRPAEVLSVPDPVPPAFLAVEPSQGVIESAATFASTPAFVWEGVEAAPSVLPKAQDTVSSSPEFSGRKESRVLSPGMLERALQEPSRTARSSVDSLGVVAQTLVAPVPQPGGYELPYAEDFADAPLTMDGVPSDADSSLLQPDDGGVTAALAELPELAQPLQVDVVADNGTEGVAADGMDALASLPIPPVAGVQSPAAVGGGVKRSLPSVEYPSIDEASGAKEVADATQRLRDDQSSNTEAEDAPEAMEHVSFVKAARRRAFWRKPVVRAGLVLAGLCLIASLATQVALHERNRIAAVAPEFRPLLVALCEPLGCELAPLRQIADVVIDSSSFNKSRGDSYVLAFTMKSRATVSLEMPAVELTLTDAQDQPVLRRVLLPAEIGAPQELVAGGEWSASVSVLVTTGGARVVGYRLLAFYP